MKPDIHCDVVIVGGGITGLWLSAVLSHAGFHVYLFEKDALGAGQTLSAQGIIHGGTKYALAGKLTGSSEAVRAMPQRWHSHLMGQRRPDLSNVNINTRYQWMWPADGMGSKIAGFFASKVMSSRVSRVANTQLPDMLQGKTVYQLEEPVLDVASLLDSLVSQSGGGVYRAEVTNVAGNEENVQVHIDTMTGPAIVQAQLVICTAGTGNEVLTSDVEMQRRGLHMVMVKGELPELWAHIIEADANPRLTITTHQANGEVLWYLGGQLAEQGVTRQPEEQVRYAKKEMESLMPRLDWDQMSWSAFKIDRAEGAQMDGSRPVQPVIEQRGRQITVWPTKLAFAPLVADEVSELVRMAGIQPGTYEPISIDMDKATVGQYPWGQAQWAGGDDG